VTTERPDTSGRVAALGRELVRVHDALREDLVSLRAAASSDVPAGSGRLLSAHCVRFCAALTRHHTAEDRRAFPALAAQHPELAPLIAKLEEDHRMIGGIVARIEEIADVVRSGGGSARLVGELDGLTAILESHFAFEERRIAGALDALGGSPVDVLGLDADLFNRSVD
jgi:hypothetical protein